MSGNSMFANFPVGQPPKGVKSDFDARAEDATTLWVLNFLTLSMVVLTVSARFYVKRFVSKQKFSWDDGFCLAAMCAAIVHSGTILKDLDYGLGKHMWNIRAFSFNHSRLLAMTSANLIIAVNMLLVRISVLALYHRLFSVYESSKTFIYVGYFLSVLIAVPEIGVVIGRMQKCSSLVSALMDSYCAKKNISIAVITFAVVGCVVDVFIYSIAIGRLRGLHVNKAKRLQLSAVFGMGLVAVLFGLANVIFNAVHFSTTDQMWYALYVAIFKMLEANIALTCACATFLPALWKDKKPAFSWVGSAFRSRSHGSAVESKGRVARSGASKGRESDDALVLPAHLRSDGSKSPESHDFVVPHHLDLPESVHSKSERSNWV